MRKPVSLAIVMAVLAVSSAAAQPAAADEPPPDAPKTRYSQTGKGCAVGALLGSVVPGVGTALGCLGVGLWAWWRA